MGWTENIMRLWRGERGSAATAGAQEEQRTEGGPEMAYQLEGRLLEVCDCKVLCPCWIGEDPNNGTCEGVVAWAIDSGEIEGVDVSGRTLAALAHIPGNILEGSWKAAIFVDDGATEEQQEAVLKVFTGQLGGAVADFAALIGEVVSVERASITSDIEGGKGTLKIGPPEEPLVEAELAPTSEPPRSRPSSRRRCSPRSPAPRPTSARPRNTGGTPRSTASPT